MRTIGYVTSSRADYGISLPVLRRIVEHPDLALHLYVTGMHLSSAFGMTVDDIRKDAIPIGTEIPALDPDDTPLAMARSMAATLSGFAESFSRFRPDILVVLGDRFEMYATALAALPFRIPVAHIHGGELTLGAIDDALRHSITKLSHLHFASTETYARRIRQLGEEAWRVHVSGAPSLDNLKDIPILALAELEAELGVDLPDPPILVTYHPVTLEHDRTDRQIAELLGALEAVANPIIFTLPNADTGNKIIRTEIAAFVARHARAHAIDNLGTRLYFNLMARAAAMVGNSSSGLIEAPSFALPVVNIGSRQDGRVRGDNVVDAGYDKASIEKAIVAALRPEFKNLLRNSPNPYGDGNASRLIVDTLHSVELNDHLTMKPFNDQPGA